MEELLNAFEKCSLKTAYQQPPFFFFDYENHLCTTSYLYENTILGEIKGVVKNIYEISHADYMVLYDEAVLDVSEQVLLQGCRDIITYMPEDSHSWKHANCVLFRNEEGRFYLKTLHSILPHQELVYRYEHPNC